jgi:hypothetical protein
MARQLGSWWIQQNFRHTNGGSFWGTQVAWGWEDNANRLATRNITGGSFGGWVYYMNTNAYPYAANMDQYVRTTDAVTFGSIYSPGNLQWVGNEYWQGRYKYLWYGYWNQWLDIYGGIGGGSLFYADTLYATYGSVSDMRYKKEVSKLTYGLDELLKMDTIKFKYDLPDKHMSKGDNTYHLGFSAQQLQDLIPELVIEDKNFNMLAITQTELLAVVVNGMKEQQEIIKNQQLEINNIKQLINN